MLSSAEGLPRHSPAEDVQVCQMAATIKGLTNSLAMRLLLIDRHGYKKGAGWMGTEAIKYEKKRAEQEAGR